LFIVDEKGDESMLDVSFKGVKVGDRSLLKLAGYDEEHN